MGLISRDWNTNHDQTALPTEQSLGTELGASMGTAEKLIPAARIIFRAAAQDYEDVNKNCKNLSNLCRALGVSADCKFLQGF